jgi:hypothetical protein
MEIVEKVKSVLIDPKKEWVTVDAENVPWTKLFTGYVLPLALIPAIAAFVGYGLIGYSVFGVRIHSIEWGIRQALIQFISMTGGVYLTAFVVNLLADNFGAKKDFDRAFATVAYSYTPMFVAGIFLIYPAGLSWITSLSGLYGLYLLYTGLKPMMKSPDDKTTGYFIFTLIVAAAVAVVLALVLASVLAGDYLSAAASLKL